PEAQREAALLEGRDPDDESPETLFLHDVPPEVAAESLRHLREQSARPFEDPWPLTGWPEIPTHVLLYHDNQLFPTPFQQHVTTKHLSITPDEIDGGHLPTLAHPDKLTN